ncbi:hypothetical protein [Chthonobacter rhizosphaerae]|uniref:hypothetical protein n=1 Tax=Chthonobacter rhizosphaerae TaxID=2735553 RepID=UPI0015EEC903|nr:hypothetical protein [Chthonobacter rhizosphaerae]
MYLDEAGDCSILWVGKQPVNGGGDEIYDSKVASHLPSHFHLNHMLLKPQNHKERAIALLQGLPHPRYKYRSSEIVNSFINAAEKSDHVIISWESFDYLAALITRPVTLILHNIISDVLLQVFDTRTIPTIAAAHSRFWESRLYRRPNVRLVVLSKRDAALVRHLAPGTRPYIAPPGSPPATLLQTAAFIPEIVLSGSYDWAPKRRDVSMLLREIEASNHSMVFRHDRPLPDIRELPGLSNLSTFIQHAEYADGLRIGLIPDSFLGGFKLKASYYVANNCMVASRSDIRGEFSGLPFSDEFVRYVPKVSDLISLMKELSDKADANMLQRWSVFKNACVDHFTWARTAAVIRDSLR